MNLCQVSVIIPTRNRLQKLCRALQSVDKQTFGDYEVWVVDDGSTDGTQDYLESGRMTRDFPGIPSLYFLINRHSQGAAAARNQAIIQSTGTFIAFLDDDDIWLPGYLEYQVNRLREHPDAASCAKHIEFDAIGNTRVPDSTPLLEYDQPLVRLLSESFVHTMSTFVCRKSVFDSIGLLNENLYVVHDWDWYARLLLSGHSILAAEESVQVKREVPGGLVAKYREWYREENFVLDMYLNEQAGLTRHRRLAGAHRALVFARIALSKGDYVFALQRLTEALWSAPLHSARLLTLRMKRQFWRERNHVNQ